MTISGSNLHATLRIARCSTRLYLHSYHPPVLIHPAGLCCACCHEQDDPMDKPDLLVSHYRLCFFRQAEKSVKV